MNWIKIESGCKMPKECESVLVTIWEDCSYGHGSDIRLHSDAAFIMKMMDISRVRTKLAALTPMLTGTKDNR